MATSDPECQPDDVPGALADLRKKGVGGVAVAQAGKDRITEWHLGELELGTYEPVEAASLFDCASVSKLVTAATVMALVEQGGIRLEDRVQGHLPAFLHPDVTLRHLLTHTSGLPATSSAWRSGQPVDAIREMVLREPVQGRPGTRHTYSCVGYVVAGLVAESAAAEPLDVLVGKLISEPLGLRDFGYRPANPQRAAATEQIAGDADQAGLGSGTGTGQYWRGVVHDELARSLGGVSGNAGIFASARDMAAFGQMFARGGEAPGGKVVLRDSTVEQMMAPQLPPGVVADGYGQGLGWRLGFNDLTGTDAFSVASHPGFTGTALVVDRDAGTAVAVLTNAVHPTREVASRTALLRPVIESVRN